MQFPYFYPSNELMEDWQLDFHFLALQHKVKDIFQRDQLPDVNALLMLIGIQETGIIRRDYTKEEKQDLMHVAVCHLMSQEGFYAFVGFDIDGWPHYEKTKIAEIKGAEAQEKWLKRLMIQYFASLTSEKDHKSILN